MRSVAPSVRAVVLCARATDGNSAVAASVANRTKTNFRMLVPNCNAEATRKPARLAGPQ